MGDILDAGAASKLFTPLDIGNGKIHLKHRVIHAPLTRNRGTPVNPESTPENPNRLWVPNDLIAEYYSQRATDGGLIISEGLPPSLEVTLKLALFTRCNLSLTQTLGKWYAGCSWHLPFRAGPRLEEGC